MVKIILWAIPRSVSTAFEKAFIQNKSVKVMHEPFSIPYYFGKDKKSNRYSDASTHVALENTFDGVCDSIINDTSDILFIKDMAYYVDEFIDSDKGRFLLSVCEHAFLFRDPKKSIYSLFKGSFDEETGWNSFDETEIGFSSLKKIYDKCLEIGKDPVVIDSDIFLSNPKMMIQEFCKRYGINYVDEMLKLEKTLPDWKVWEPWHKVAIESKEFMSVVKDYDDEILIKISPYVESNKEYYNYFKERCLVLLR